jgi:hypothetical protein
MKFRRNYCVGVETLITIKSIVVASGLCEPWRQNITAGSMLCFFIVVKRGTLQARQRVHVGDMSPQV